MEQNRESRNKSMHIWTINLQKKEARIYNGEKTVSLMNGAGKTEQSRAKE